MPSLFSRKPIAELVAEGEHASGLKRALGAGDLVMLSIGAVIGAGIFSSIGTAAAVVGDTVGDPWKDTAGPSLHVLVKLLATITLVLAPLFI